MNRTDADGRPIFECCGHELRVEGDVIVLALHYVVNAQQDPRNPAKTAFLALTPKIAAQLSGALQAGVLQAKGGSVTPLRPPRGH